MAIKAALAAALLVALVALTTATTYTTTTITTAAPDEEGNPFGRCSPQLQYRQFRPCQRFLAQRGGPRNEEDGGDGDNEDNYQQAGQQYLQECCRQLREVDRQGCGCEGIRQAARQTQQGYFGQQPGQSQRVYQKAQMLPRMCNLREQQCRFRVVFL